MKTYYLSQKDERGILPPHLQTESKEKALEWLDTYATAKAGYVVWTEKQHPEIGKEIVGEKGGIAHFSTHIGLSEYDGNQHIYDGNFEETFRGTREEVVAFLQSLLSQIHPEEDSLKWQGGNGWWYSGEEAAAAIRAEIANPIADDQPSPNHL